MSRIDTIIADAIIIDIDDADLGHLTDRDLSPYQPIEQHAEAAALDGTEDLPGLIDHDDHDPCAEWTAAEIAAEIARANSLELPY